MAKAPIPPDDVAHRALCKAHADHRVIFFTDPHVLNRPDSPVYSPVDVFVPTLVLMGGSLTLLFAFGLVEWMVALVLVLLYQVYGAKRVVEYRMHKRTVDAVLRNPYNLQILWQMGGIAVALKDWPERNVIAPLGDWRVFARDYLIDLNPPDAPEE
ncbi:MAG TPA: hypothetical protein VK558_15435 [Patescibacteria group bacterium]|nr:hypothetical protein [Patescibacteria group bacterium]